MKRALIITFAITILAASGAYAQHGGPEHGEPAHGFGGPAIIGSDGTVYVTKASATAGSVDIVAIRSTGAAAWTATISDRGRLLLADGNLLSASDTRSSDGTFTSTITAISTGSGNVAWTKSFTGLAEPIGAFNGGTYVSVVVPAATQGGTATRSLVGLSDSGAVLWTTTL
ncbi:MAG TPA: hypothetical protein VJ901_03980 [Thermoanaerobaculia bacterium]|nr:hypothetical protein [Thermoanaerobaculia bacterium]